MRDWNRMKDNSIHLGGYRVNQVKTHKIVAYNEVTYGSNVKPMKESLMSNGASIFSNEINLSKMVGTHLLLTAKKAEFISDNNIIDIDTTSRCNINDRKDRKYESSEVVVLGIFVLNKQRSNNTGWAWGKKHHTMISKSNKT